MGGLAVTLGRTRIGVLFAETLAAPGAVWSHRDAEFDVTVITRRGSKPASTRIRGIRCAEVLAAERDLAECRRLTKDPAQVCGSPA